MDEEIATGRKHPREEELGPELGVRRIAKATLLALDSWAPRSAEGA